MKEQPRSVDYFAMREEWRTGVGCLLCRGQAHFEFAALPLCMTHAIMTVNGLIHLDCPACEGSGREWCPNCEKGTYRNGKWERTYCNRQGCNVLNPGRRLCSVCKGERLITGFNRYAVESWVRRADKIYFGEYQPRAKLPQKSGRSQRGEQLGLGVGK